MKKYVFPGSFDPITLGHQDIIERALPLCDSLIIAVGENSDKKYMFSLQKRVEFISKTFADEPKSVLKHIKGLRSISVRKLKLLHF